MDRSIRMCSLAVLLIAALFVCNAKAYWSGSLGTKHEEVANAVLNYPTMQYYKAALIANGYSISSIVSTADSEPDPHNGWSWISNSSKLSDAALSNYNIGMILHAAADGSVGSKHEPAILETDLGHTIWEQTAEALTLPAMDYYSNVRVGSFDTKMDDIYADQLVIDQDYYDWYYDQWIPLPYDADVETMIHNGLHNSLEMGEATLKQYFDYRELVCPSYVVADWRFDEGSGQLVYNAKGSITADFRLGSGTGTDDSDPTWSTSGYNGTKALYFDKYTTNGSVANYTRNTTKWTSYEADIMAPTSGNYTIEVIFKPSSLDHVSTLDSDHPYPIYTYSDVTSGELQYALKLVYTSAGHHAVSYTMAHADGATTELIFDVQAAGLEMAAGNWYYIIMFRNNGYIRLAVRDMASGTMVWSDGITCEELPGIPSSSTNFKFLVGSEAIGRGPCFHGYVDRLRISNAWVGPAGRLYNNY